MAGKTTAEQRSVIDHPIGNHARVLAVAGSGKTTTMVLRIRQLLKQDVNPATILVLMYNRQAANDFKVKLEKFGVALNQRPKVHTFHSYAYSVLGFMQSKGLLPNNTQFWGEDKEELVRLYTHRAIQNLDARGELADPPPPEISEVMEAVGLWKGSLIPPDRAGYRGHGDMPRIYAEFEKLRHRENAITFDDFVPQAVDILETQHAVSGEWLDKFDHLIVDEYQDVNYGQQRLIELLAGKRADVMVVGDDDQTIYEWRGARPNYIIREFKTVFANKPHYEYKLSQTFRFGPIIAQCAENVIGFNTTRATKALVANNVASNSRIELYVDNSEQEVDASRDLANEVEILLKKQSVDPKDIIVLVRMFVQLGSLEKEFYERSIPYHVFGSAPFFERREIRVLLDYVRFARVLDERWSAKAEDWLISIANTPNRRIPKAALKGAMQLVRTRKAPVLQALIAISEDPDNNLRRSQREALDELLNFLQLLREQLDDPKVTAGSLLTWMVEQLKYEDHFDSYYGTGEHSFERKTAVKQFAKYAQGTGLPPMAFVEHVEKIDPTQGVPADQQIRMTTIFRTKGLEYNYVVIPQCEEGYMPSLAQSESRVFDTANIVQEPEPSESIENERRLFYVAITRAKKCVFIGTASPPKQGSLTKVARPSRFLEEMQRDSVLSVMSPITRIKGGDTDAREELLNVLNLPHVAGRAWVHDQLIASYVADLDDEELTGKLATRIARAPKLPFAYTQAYPQVQRPSRERQRDDDEDLPF